MMTKESSARRFCDDENLARRFLGNNPTNATDPTGLKECPRPAVRADADKIADAKKKADEVKRQSEERALRTWSLAEKSAAGITPQMRARLVLATIPEALVQPTKGQKLTIVVDPPPRSAGAGAGKLGDKVTLKILGKIFDLPAGDGIYNIVLKEDYKPFNILEKVMNIADNPKDNGIAMVVTVKRNLPDNAQPPRYKQGETQWGWKNLPVYLTKEDLEKGQKMLLGNP